MDRSVDQCLLVREDVNGDGQVTALDALLIVNRLNSDRNSDGSLSGNYSDVNRDGLITAIDALWVVDRLNQRFGSSSAPLGISQMETRDAVLSEFEFDLDIVNNRKRVTKRRTQLHDTSQIRTRDFRLFAAGGWSPPLPSGGTR